MDTLAPRVLEQSGQIVSAFEVQAGAALAADAAIGTSVLVVDELGDFADDGGLLQLASATEASEASSAVLRYLSIDRDASTIALEVPLDALAFSAGDTVWISPPATERRAEVALEGDGDQLVTARIPFALSGTIPIGVRDENAGEWIRLGITELGYTVLDLEDEYAFTDPASIVITDPDTGEIIGGIGGDASFDTITADEVISPSVPYRNAEDLTLYLDPLNGSDDNGGEALVPLVDTFERAGSGNVLGTSDSGHLWTSLVAQGPAADIVSGRARLVLNGASLRCVQRSAFACLDGEMSGRMLFVSLPTAGVVEAGYAMRIATSNDFLYTYFTINSAARLQLGIGWNNAGTYTPAVPELTLLGAGLYVPGADWNLRTQVQTTPEGLVEVRAKAWALGAAEPDDWMLTAAFSPQGVLNTAGGWGMVIRSGNSVTGTCRASFDDLGAGVIDESGVLIDITEGGVGPMKTIASALALVGEWNDGQVKIILGAGAYEEDVLILGLAGGGLLTIDGADVATIYGAVRVTGAAAGIYLRDLIVQDTGNPIGGNAGISIRTSSYVLCISLSVQANGLRGSAIEYLEGAHGRVEDCQMNGGTARCLYATNGSSVVAIDGKGNTTPAGGTSYHSAAAQIYQSGTKPTPATATTLGGRIDGTTSSNSGGSEPPPNPKRTVTIAANSSKTWRPQWAWKDGTDTYQGEYAGSGGLSRGCAFYGTKFARGGTAISGKVYIKRLNSGGSSGAEAIYLATHNETAKPSGDTGPTLKNGPQKVGELAWGQGKWFEIPKAWVQDLMNGSSRGLMLYHGSASPYVICDGYGGDRWKCSITYQP